MGILRIIMGNFDIERAKKEIDFLVNSLVVLGIDTIRLIVPPLFRKEIDVRRDLRFLLFKNLANGKPVEMQIEAPEDELLFLEEEFGSGLSGAIITLETTPNQNVI